MGDGVSLPIPPQFGCDECILTHITLYLNQKGGKSRAKLVGSSWYLTPLLWDTPDEIVAEDSHQPDIHLDDAGNEPDMPADTDDLPDVSMDRPLAVDVTVTAGYNQFPCLRLGRTRRTRRVLKVHTAECIDTISART